MQAISETERAVQELVNAHGWWNTWSVRLVALTVIVTALYFVAQWMTNRRGNELSEAQAALIRAKDGQLATDLKNKDVSISSADQKAADAKRDTARLTKEAEQARAERAEADKQIAIAKADAARAREGAEIAKADALRAKEGIANAEARSTEAAAEVARLQIVVANAETNRLKAEKTLLEIQRQVSNRVITTEQSEKFLAFVSRFTERGKVTIECSNPTPETLNFGVQIQNLLIKAGWDVKLEAPLSAGGKTYFGVVLRLQRLRVASPSDPLYHARVLAEGFKQVDIPFAVEEAKDQAPEQVLLLVGPNFIP